jgi:hypothetical protein
MAEIVGEVGSELSVVSSVDVEQKRGCSGLVAHACLNLCVVEVEFGEYAVISGVAAAAVSCICLPYDSRTDSSSL